MTLKEAISTLMENICMSCAYDAECMDKCDIRGCDNRDAIKVIIGETEKHRWIPVTERLPDKEHTKYVVTLDNGEVENRWWLGCFWVESVGKVIAWKPLPKPYEGSETE